MFDVCIIGAGPAGTAAAFDLLDQGMSVLILDKYEFPRKKACAGGITPKGYDLFKYDVSSMVRQTCSSIFIQPSSKNGFCISNDRPLCYMTNRSELDLFSLNTIVTKGACFKVVPKILSIEETPSCVNINTCSGGFKAAFLIGADGANSMVRRFITKKKFFKKQFAIEADVRVDRPDQFKMEFDFSRSKRGYFWIFPKHDHLNIGIYSTDHSAKVKIRQLFEFAKERFNSTRLESIKGYPICTNGRAYHPERQRILLAGDAAGMAEPLFGEGIYFALKSGQAAARAIFNADNQQTSAGFEYKHLLKPIQSDLRLYDMSASFFYRFKALSLSIASFPHVQNRFSNGYANGHTLSGMIFHRS